MWLRSLHFTASIWVDFKCFLCICRAQQCWSWDCTRRTLSRYLNTTLYLQKRAGIRWRSRPERSTTEPSTRRRGPTSPGRQAWRGCAAATGPCRWGRGLPSLWGGLHEEMCPVVELLHLWDLLPLAMQQKQTHDETCKRAPQHSGKSDFKLKILTFLFENANQNFEIDESQCRKI